MRRGVERREGRPGGPRVTWLATFSSNLLYQDAAPAAASDHEAALRAPQSLKEEVKCSSFQSQDSPQVGPSLQAARASPRGLAQSVFKCHCS